MIRTNLGALVALVLVAGCESMTVDNPFDAPPLAVRLGDATAAPVSLVRGQSLVVTLPANLTTGYRWEPLPGFTPALTLTGTPDYSVPGVAPSAAPAQPVATTPLRDISFTPTLIAVGATAQASPPNTPPAQVGEGGQTFVFLAATPGTAALELAYRKPFEPNVAPVKTVRYDVTVR